MKCIEYNNALNIKVMFLDNHRCVINTCWGNFIKGKIRNPYHNSIYGIGIVGNKYPTNNKNNKAKEYMCWHDMIYRTTQHFKNSNSTYMECIISDDWIYYSNFYEWLHSQENFEKWNMGKKWCLDKDILFKHNKKYSSATCLLVPTNVNTLFVKKDANRGNLPIGVIKNHNKFISLCSNPFTKNNKEYLGNYNTPEEAFYAYKNYKENIIKMVAEAEYKNKNITKLCYDAMINYNVEISD